MAEPALAFGETLAETLSATTMVKPSSALSLAMSIQPCSRDNDEPWQTAPMRYVDALPQVITVLAKPARDEEGIRGGRIAASDLLKACPQWTPRFMRMASGAAGRSSSRAWMYLGQLPKLCATRMSNHSSVARAIRPFTRFLRRVWNSSPRAPMSAPSTSVLLRGSPKIGRAITRSVQEYDGVQPEVQGAASGRPFALKKSSAVHECAPGQDDV